MTTMIFKKEINAPANKVWFALWDNLYYMKWTSAFSEGSYAVSDWKQGSKIHFLAPSGDGIYGNIDLMVKYEKMYFRQEGVLKDFKEQPADDETRLWSGAMEKYELAESGGITVLTVYLDTLESYIDEFNNKFPVALDLVKHSAEHLSIIIQSNLNISVERAWTAYTDPAHIVKWNNASADWHTTKAENNLVKGGRFTSRMEAKDGSAGFDFGGVYDQVVTHELIAYTLDDGRKVTVNFSAGNNQTSISVSFEPEDMNSLELQKFGWQSILDNFRLYAERIA
jgi:uncharacterized protein YndB with AHSA1/START domain